MAKRGPSSQRGSLLAAADKYLDESLQRGVIPHANELARIVGLSPYHFSNAFLRQVGVRPGFYLKHAQQQCAVKLLTTTTLPLAIIARKCGYASEVTFHRAFKRAHGLTPTTFRNRHRK